MATAGYLLPTQGVTRSPAYCSPCPPCLCSPFICQFDSPEGWPRLTAGVCPDGHWFLLCAHYLSKLALSFRKRNVVEMHRPTSPPTYRRCSWPLLSFLSYQIGCDAHSADRDERNRERAVVCLCSPPSLSQDFIGVAQYEANTFPSPPCN